VADRPLFEAVAGEVGQALDVPALVAHNAHVDTGVLKRHLPDWDVPEVFDTLRLARRLLPDQPSYQLGKLVCAYNLDEGLPDSLAPHRAAYDALVTARLFVHLVTSSGNRPLTLETLRGDAPGRGSFEASPLF
jgi:exodeoxyribonuclease X